MGTSFSNYTEAAKRITDWLALNNPTIELNLSNLGLKKLPQIPSTCQILDCHCNELTSLTALPNCQVLYCDYNQLTSLPALPNCQTLFCMNNKLTSLPVLPNCQILFCHNNKYLYINKQQAIQFQL